MHMRTAVAAFSFACLATLATAQAAVINVPVGDGTLASGAMLAGKTTLVASTPFENWIGLVRANPFPLDAVSTQQVVVGPFLGVGGAVTGLTYDDSSAQVLKVNTQVGLGLILPADPTLQIGGGSAQIRVSQLDLSQPNTVAVYGSIIGTSKANVAVNFTGLLASTSPSQLTGSTVPTDLSAQPLSITASQLMLSSEALGALDAVYMLDAAGLGHASLLSGGASLGSLNVKVSMGTIPEPGSAVLMGLGIAALGWQARRRTARA